MRFSFLPLLGTAAFLLSLPAASQCSEARLEASDASQLHHFGGAVAVSGDTALVGAMNAGGSGAVYVFERAAGAWVETQTLTVASVNAGFGASVAIEADLAVIGGTGAVGGGSAWIFERGPGGWSQVAELVRSELLREFDIGPGFELAFGADVAISGERAVVGMPRLSELSSRRGSAFVFERAGAAWNQVAELVPSTRSIRDRFGSAVDIDGDRIVIGSFGNSLAGFNTGAVFVFQRSAAGWSETDVILSAAPFTGASWGSDVSLSGDRLLIGEAGNAAAWIFDRIAGVWTQSARLDAPGTTSADHYATALALDGDRALVAAPLDELPGGPDKMGVAYLFERAPAGWSLLSTLTPVASEAVARFGSSVDLDGGQAFLGAPFENSATSLDAGAAYSFAASGPVGTIVCLGALNSTGARAALAADGCPFLVFDRLALQVSGLPASAPGVLLMSSAIDLVFDFGGGQGTLCLAQPLLRFAPFVPGATGSATLPIDFAALPGGVTFAPGDTWHFQVWYRDANPLPTSNLSSSLAIEFR